MIVVTAVIFATAFFMCMAVCAAISVRVLMRVCTAAIVFATALVCVVMVAAIVFATTSSCMVVRVLSSIGMGMFVIMGRHGSFSFKKFSKMQPKNLPLSVLCIKNNPFANNRLLQELNVIIL